MDDPSRAGSHPLRDPRLYLMDPMEMSCFDIRASAEPAPKRSMDPTVKKREPRTSATPRISLIHHVKESGPWMTARTPPPHRSRLRFTNHVSQPEQQMHQSTCLNLSTDPDSTGSDLWILPDFDEWEIESDAHQQSYPVAKEGSWAPLVKRAVNSNRERLRRRLEGDGWDFVGGKYGEDGTALKGEVDASVESEESEESVDEEFDVVVLPVTRLSC